MNHFEWYCVLCSLQWIIKNILFNVGYLLYSIQHGGQGSHLSLAYRVLNENNCDATCQNQALLTEMGFWFIVLFNKSVSLAFIWYIIHVSSPHQSKTMGSSKCYCTWLMQNHWTKKKAAKSWKFTCLRKHFEKNF